MSRSRFQQYFAAWLACFAVILASVAPSVSQVLAAQQSHHVATRHHHAASASDMQAHEHPAAAVADSSLPSKHGQHAASCPFCHTNAASFALLPLVASFLAGEAGKASALPAPPLLSIAYVAWTSIQPRAPPAGNSALS